MESTLNAAPTATVNAAMNHLPMQELTTYHQQLQSQFNSLPIIDTTPFASMPVVAFNGYYTVNNSQGGFFAIDTNMVVQNGNAAYDVCLLISLDGKTSARFPFTGTFENNILTQGSKTITNELYVNLTFTRTDGTDGSTATMSGTIALPNQSPVNVSGLTYSNPIPMFVFNGKYATKTNPSNTVMQIQGNTLMYQYPGTSSLVAVDSFVYNMNMYFFSFDNGTATNPATTSFRLIMGTASASGLVCNNMVIDLATSTATSVSVETIPKGVQPTPKVPNLSGSELAAFSGYYELTVAPGAFIAIQGQYIFVQGIGEIYAVLISYSMDGVTSTGYGFELTGMSFTGNVLTINGATGQPDILKLTFDRSYAANEGTLVNVSGTINGTSVNGYTRFNPVPLSDFSGSAMTNNLGVSLTVISDDEVLYAGKQFATPMQNILYVPDMYILAYPAVNPTVVMSFGTDGLQGNACIVTDNNNIYSVTAIPAKG